MLEVRAVGVGDPDQERPADEVEGETGERPELPDYVAALRARLMEVAAKDPSIKKFLEDPRQAPITMAEFSDFWKTLSDEEKAAAKKVVMEAREG